MSTMQNVEVKMTANCHIRRRILSAPSSFFDLFDTASHLVELEEANSCEKVVISNISKAKAVRTNTCTPPVISNVCGKIEHLLPQYYTDVYAPSISPSVRRISNKFGRFDCLFTSHCNLLTSISRSYTMFRGGHSMKDTLEMIQQCVLPETIYTNTVHMLVINTRLGRPIQVDSLQIKNDLDRDTRWKVRLLNNADETGSNCDLLLSQIDVNALREQANFSRDEPDEPDETDAPNLLPNLFPTKIKMLITKLGNVNMFLSMPSVPLKDYAKIEDHVMFLTREIVRVLMMAT